ncbi:hypothetical protein ERD78_11755 [Allopusillimonas soli]|uniref:Uncharacterized protein n=1 Tax=Allopusillimonas soli TaxID=659016 RepID=A0A853FCI7_9BURK|nr:hypothetical protein [Allopusillimonas soli]NYT37372.1 hypothetical protein [Allopusillimonas soli]TEA74646.1 hypothetical protein ERD78_11755 [Allopusillimonas soli]
MTKARIEPGIKSINPSRESDLEKNKDRIRREKDVLPELGLKRPDKSNKPQADAPLGTGVDSDQ